MSAATKSLWRIAETDSTHEIESVLADGGDINATNAHGATALSRAVANGQVRMVRALLEHGADPNISRSDKFTPLLLAAFFGQHEIVRILVEYGADIQAATRFGTSAQMWATARTFHDVAAYLQTPGIDHSDAGRRQPAQKKEALLTRSSKLSFAAIVPRYQPRKRWLVGFALLLFVIAFAMATLRIRQGTTEAMTETQPGVAVNGAVASGAESVPQARTISTTAEKVDATEMDTGHGAHYEKPERMKKATAANVISVAGTSARSKLTEDQNVAKQASLIQIEPKNLRNSELPATVSPAPASALTPRLTSVVPSEPAATTEPSPVNTELISPSKTSGPKGRVIKWP